MASSPPRLIRVADFSNGPVWVQDLGDLLGFSSLDPSQRGGTDFAYGGAQTGTTPLHQANFYDLPSQFMQFASQTPYPQPGALSLYGAAGPIS